MDSNLNEKKETTKVNKTASIPLADISFGKLSISVAETWLKNDWMTLRYIKSDEFKTKAILYNNILTERNASGSERPQITNTLKSINTEINESLSYIKGYLAEKYGKKNAVSYYASFGFEHYNKKYIFPNDQNKRISALEKLISGVVQHNFQDNKYGLNFWTVQKEKLEKYVALGDSTDGNISIKVGDKNVLKKELKIIINSLINLIKGHFPDTYKNELRNWGFQKEKY